MNEDEREIEWLKQLKSILSIKFDDKLHTCRVTTNTLLGFLTNEAYELFKKWAEGEEK
jgi:NTP pyrophosphatase (non-canonical NTP hydrolase)